MAPPASIISDGPNLVQVAAAQACCNETWEEAYQRFETPEEEVRKFLGRLRRLGAAAWPRDARIVELFCGRGNGLHALAQLGFTNLEGVDLSAALLAKYTGPARLCLGDCRTLPFEDGSRDVVIVQGGLHHLERIPEDLERVLAEARRVLRPGGRIMIVEPWRTPFLSFVHWLLGSPLACRLYPKLGALAVMTRHEARTYFDWLDKPDVIRAALRRHFAEERCRIAWGKLNFLGRKRGPA
jgi:SAM-dependent methyltransferase